MAEYIEQEAAREAVWQILNGIGYSEKHNDRLVEEVDAILDDIPAADVRPVVHGWWIMPNADKSDRPMPECSHCGWYVDNGGVKDFSFCPNCGADMREER